MGYIISAKKGIEPDPDKMKAIIDMKRSSNVLEIRRFLGMVHYQLKFVEQLANLTKPLLKEETESTWTMTQETAFTKIKKKLVESPALIFLTRTVKYEC